MIDTINILALEEEFYNKKFFFSYSSLSKLLYSPKLFYSQYVLKQREEKTDAHLIEGKVIHCLLLEEDKFNEKFIISPLLLPSDNIKGLVDRVFRIAKENNQLDLDLKDHKDSILAILTEINLHQSLKTDDQRIDKVVNDASESYFSYLKEKEGRDVIDYSTYNNCKQIVDALRNNTKAANVLKLGPIEVGVDTHSELYLETELKDRPFGIKGVIDRLVIDHNNKSITIVDFKTTGKSIVEFPESVDYYKYWLQSGIYKMLIEKIYLEKLPGYSVEFKFVVVDKYMQSYVFPVTDSTANKWIKDAEDLLKTAEFHYKSRKYDLPYAFEMDLVLL
jgi:hypothetical protein